jgi:hypothetical protein
MQKDLARLLRQLDEIGLSKLLVEMALFGSVESSSPEGADALTTAARRHRVDVAKLRRRPHLPTRRAAHFLLGNGH